ncbi:hypothetical protein HMPREF3187_00782 [Aerococcus christensenii]|uniref:Uncharacterized protein n=1 Tax=Aerococcus christensenii TaxID=87541 RepID=A0A133XZZ5_9LACT|nr:hypothetical protein HMPREF3187_00782 [Aerococcus christensenii]
MVTPYQGLNFYKSSPDAFTHFWNMLHKFLINYNKTFANI